ncbi:membrane hypothetical protein [Candidatus Zixiibacteriota bacterium]|nr:membrane hypothetical protein [candidate division Zixibacteria bacterium]
MKGKSNIQFIFLILIVALYLFHALNLSFTQDDSYISYRYVQNFLDGKGLVFNPGEYVEGYTNFLLIIILIFFGKLGINYIIASKAIGLVSGTGILILSFLWGKKYSRGGISEIIPSAVPLLLASNAAFAYWSMSGMETTLFALLIFLGLYLASENSLLYVPVLALGALTRPDGAVVFGSIILYKIISRNSSLRAASRDIALFVLLLLPQFIFRIFYYHDLLPNTFYAKTGWSLAYIGRGLEYIWLSLRHYGLFGLLFIVPILAWRIMDRKLRLVFFVSLLFALYIIWVGGDVFHEHRFFVSMIPAYYLVFVIGTSLLSGKLFQSNRTWRIAMVSLFLTVFLILTVILPFDEMRSSREAMKSLVGKMGNWATVLNHSLPGHYTIACATIGALGYYGHGDLIDMVGLTDRTIAKEPQPPVPGIASDWREKNYNIPYLMRRKPDFILFSTGIKPTAPAEKALFLSSVFRRDYYPVFYEGQKSMAIYKRLSDSTGADRYFADPHFVDLFIDALNAFGTHNYDAAYELAGRSVQSGPEDFYLPVVLMGEVRMAQGRFDEGVPLLQRADSIAGGRAIIADAVLEKYFADKGNRSAASAYRKNIESYNHLD